MKHYTSLEFLSNFQNATPSCTNVTPLSSDGFDTLLSLEKAETRRKLCTVFACHESCPTRS